MQTNDGLQTFRTLGEMAAKKIKDCNQVLPVECANSRQDCNLYILPADEAAICTYRQQNICCNLYIIPADKAAICTLYRQTRLQFVHYTGRRGCNLYILPADEAAICTLDRQTRLQFVHTGNKTFVAICTLYRQTRLLFAHYTGNTWLQSFIIFSSHSTQHPTSLAALFVHIEVICLPAEKNVNKFFHYY